jgi:hypothetical protein
MQAKVGTNHRSSSAWIGTVAELLLFVVLLPGADSSNPTEIIGGEQDRGARLQGALVVLGQDDEVDNAVFPLMHHGTCRPESGHDLFCRADESPGSRHGSALYLVHMLRKIFKYIMESRWRDVSRPVDENINKRIA